MMSSRPVRIKPTELTICRTFCRAPEVPACVMNATAVILKEIRVRMKMFIAVSLY